jgi:hypothetical protein
MKLLAVLNVIIILAVLLVIAIGYGRRDDVSHVPVGYEHFSDMSAQEEELFEDLKQNKLSEQDIKKLIEEGMLNDSTIDKFLKKLDFPPIVKVSDTMKDKKEGFADFSKEAWKDRIEPFSCENKFVGSPQTWHNVASWWDGTAQTMTTENNPKKNRGECFRA